MLLAFALTACGGDDDTASDDFEPTVDSTQSADTSDEPAATGDEALAQSVIDQTVELLSQEPRNEFDPGEVIAHLVSYADAYAEIAAEAPNLLGQLPSAPAGTAWLARAEGSFIYTQDCPASGCEPALGTYFFIYNEDGQLGQGIFVGERY